MINLFLNASVSVGTGGSAYGTNTPELAVNGNDAMWDAWIRQNPEISGNTWIQIDAGSSLLLGLVRIYQAEPLHRAGTIKVYGSTSASGPFTEISSITTNLIDDITYGITPVPTIPYRYYRFVITALRAEQTGYWRVNSIEGYEYGPTTYCGRWGLLTFFSSIGVDKVFDLWNGVGNNPPPAGWYLPAFNDSAWVLAAAGETDPTLIDPIFTVQGAQPLWVPGGLPYQTGFTGQAILSRRTLTLPAITPTFGSLAVMTDDRCDEVYVNGTLLNPEGPLPGYVVELAVPTALLVFGGSNVIAIHGSDVFGASAKQEWRLCIIQNVSAVPSWARITGL